VNHGAVNPGAVNHGAVNHGDLVEVSLGNLREHRADAARWLAVEVLLSDETALEDDELVTRLHTLQGRLEDQTPKVRRSLSALERGLEAPKSSVNGDMPALWGRELYLPGKCFRRPRVMNWSTIRLSRIS
jgi:hypothetical protein